MARLAILLVPFPWIPKRLGRAGSESAEALGPRELRLARQVAELVSAASRHTPRRKDTASLEADAWLRCVPLFVTGGSGGRFGEVASFG